MANPHAASVAISPPSTHVKLMTESSVAGVIRLGALDWRYKAWTGTFYPADMPEEWRLTYYNTQFNCVYLPRDAWQAAGAASWHQWHEDTHDQFRFLLEAGTEQAPPEVFQGKALALSPGDGRILWFDRESSLKAMATALSAGQGEVPEYLISRDGDLSQMERVATLLDVMGLGG
jgi:hypothetical protein